MDRRGVDPVAAARRGGGRCRARLRAHGARPVRTSSRPHTRHADDARGSSGSIFEQTLVYSLNRSVRSAISRPPSALAGPAVGPVPVRGRAMRRGGSRSRWHCGGGAVDLFGGAGSPCGVDGFAAGRRRRRRPTRPNHAGDPLARGGTLRQSSSVRSLRWSNDCMMHTLMCSAVLDERHPPGPLANVLRLGFHPI